MNLSVKHLLGIKDLSPQDIELIFTTADNFKEVINRPIKKVPSLRDTTIANLFFENSTRTKLSFELAEKRLSADGLEIQRLIAISLPFLSIQTVLNFFANRVFCIRSGDINTLLTHQTDLLILKCLT